MDEQEQKPRVGGVCSYFDDRFYRIVFNDDFIDYYPSVTTKLNASPKPFLARWRGDVGNREADMRMYDASQKGTRIHYACSLLVDDGVVLYNPFNHPHFSQEQIKEIQGQVDREVFILQDQDDMWQVAKFKAWLDTVNPGIIGRDLIVADHENREAGTIDFVFSVKAGEYMVAGAKPLVFKEDGVYIVDLKTGNDIHDEHYMQIAAYAKAYDTPVAGGLVIHTNARRTKKGIEGLTTHMRNGEQMVEDYESFRHIAAIWDRQNPNATPQMVEFPSMITMREDL
jgi:hypothetical protein